MEGLLGGADAAAEADDLADVGLRRLRGFGDVLEAAEPKLSERRVLADN